MHTSKLEARANAGMEEGQDLNFPDNWELNDFLCIQSLHLPKEFPLGPTS